MPKQNRRTKFKRQQKPPVLKLQKRDTEVLKMIADYGALSSAHVYALLGAKTDGAIRRLQERLSRLFHNGYLYRPLQQITLEVHKQIFSSQYGNVKPNRHLIYAISQKGADAAFLDDPERRRQISWQTKIYKRQHLNLWHALMVAEIHVALSLLDKKKHGAELVLWKQGEDMNPRAPQVTVREKNGTVKRKVKPDAYFVIEKNGYAYHFFLEADRSTMTVARFADKLRAYWRLWAEKKHATHFGIGERTGFRVLTETISEARAENLRRAGKQADDAKKGSSMFYFTCAKNINFEDPKSVLNPIWKTPAEEGRRDILR